MSEGAWDAMLKDEAESALARRRTLARLPKPVLIDLVVELEAAYNAAPEVATPSPPMGLHP